MTVASVGRWHSQTLLGGGDVPPEQRGDCVRACITSILGLPITAVENTHGDDCWDRLRGEVHRHGYELVCIDTKYEPPLDAYWIATLPSLNLGPDPDGNPADHCVVARGYTLIHDPSLGKRYDDAAWAEAWNTDQVTDGWVLVPLDPAPGAMTSHGEVRIVVRQDPFGLAGGTEQAEERMIPDPYLTGTGQRIWTHDPALCEGRGCVIHHPSDHHMKDWPTNWRHGGAFDIKPPHMERICPHGIGHPDPDDVAFLGADVIGVHGCDGCCKPPHPVPERVRENLHTRLDELLNMYSWDPRALETTASWDYGKTSHGEVRIVVRQDP